MFNKVSKYLIASVLVIVPLYPKFPLINIHGTYVAIRMEDFLIALIGIFVLSQVILRLKSYLKNDVMKAIFIFLTVGFVSLVSAVLITKTVVPSIGLLHFVRRIEYFIPFFAGYLVFVNPESTKEKLSFVVKCLLVVTSIAFIYGFGQRFFSWPVIITQDQEYSKGVALKWTAGSHISSTFAGHYDLASYLVLILPIFIVLFFSLKEKYNKLMVGLVIAGGLWLLVSTISRTSVVAYLLASSLALLYLKKYREIITVLIISFVVFASSMNLLGRYLNLKNIFSFQISPVYAQEASAISKPVIEDRSTSIRLNAEWPRAIRAFLKNPLLGTGYSSISLATDNDYFRLLGEVGILGFSAFVLIVTKIGFLFICARKIIEKFSIIEKVFLAGIVGGFGGILLNALFLDVFEASKVAITLWFLIGISVKLIENKLNEQII